MSLNQRAIVLDDSKTVLATVRIALEGLGFAVTTACDASELVPEEVASAAVIVVDVQMEHVFGDDVVSFLRESWQVKAPIFLYSSLPKDELDERARAAGATAAVSKAAGVSALVVEVKRALGMS